MSLMYPWKLMAAGPNIFTTVSEAGVPPLVPLTMWYATRQACIDAVIDLILGTETEPPPYDATYPDGTYKRIAEGICASAWGFVITNTDLGVPDSEAGALFKAAASALLGPQGECVNTALSTLIVGFNTQTSQSGTRVGCINPDPESPCAFIPGYPPSEYQIAEMNRMSQAAADAYRAVKYDTYVFQRLPYA